MNYRWAYTIAWVGLLLLNLGCKKEKIAAPPLIFGHAGTALSPERAVYPPNSELAIAYGLDALNADGVEIDVQMTKDSVLVLFHDNFLNPDFESNSPTAECVASLTWAELQTLPNNQENPVVLLSKALPEILQRGKFAFLDVKHYNFCSESFINFSAFNWAINQLLDPLTSLEKKRTTVNCRNIDLLATLSDTTVQKSFETEDVELGISYQATFGINLITTKLSAFTGAKALQLENAELDYAFYQVKTRADIKAAAEYAPYLLISDNIAATRRYYY